MFSNESLQSNLLFFNPDARQVVRDRHEKHILFGISKISMDVIFKEFCKKIDAAKAIEKSFVKNGIRTQLVLNF